MKILFRAPLNQPLELMEVENDLKAVQKMIGGYINWVNISKDIVCIFDEDGMPKQLENNFYHDQHGGILGNCIFCSVNGTDFTSLTDKQIEFVSEYIGFPVK